MIRYEYFGKSLIAMGIDYIKKNRGTQLYIDL